MSVAAFQPIGTTSDGTLLLYTAPAQLTANPTEAQFAEYVRQLRAVQRPWIWVVDCRGTTLDHFSNVPFAQRLARILREEHAHLLKDTWVMYLNSWLRATLTFFGAPVTILATERLELFVQLQKAQVPLASQEWFFKQLTGSSLV
jgi:hypothetical protein